MDRQTPGGRAHTLPLQLNRLIGRERKVATVRQRLTAPEVRLGTLSGPLGAGKTRLALQAAGDLQGAGKRGTTTG